MDAVVSFIVDNAGHSSAGYLLRHLATTVTRAWHGGLFHIHSPVGATAISYATPCT